MTELFFTASHSSSHLLGKYYTPGTFLIQNSDLEIKVEVTYDSFDCMQSSHFFIPLKGFRVTKPMLLWYIRMALDICVAQGFSGVGFIFVMYWKTIPVVT